MSSYNAYSPRISSYTSPPSKYSSSAGYSSVSSYWYKPPPYSSSLSKYRSPSTYLSSYTTPTITRQSSYLSTREPKFTSVSSYTSAISSPASDYSWRSDSSTLWRSPSLSRRSSSLGIVPSYTSCTSNLDQPSLYGSNLSQTEITYKDEKSGIGINNLGNTCFMNAILQCLCHSPSLVGYCMRDSYLSDVNSASPSRGDLIKAFAEFVKLITDPKTTIAVSPYNLRREVQKYSRRFAGDNQQDAHEFLCYLLQGLHDDVNRARGRSTSRIRGSENDSISSWLNYQARDDSMILDLFGGQLKSTLKCTECNNESITYDPFLDLSLPLPEGSRRATLNDCFNLFAQPEVLDGSDKPNCDVCKKKTKSTKRMQVQKFPKILVFHLKRFSSTRFGQKLNMLVDFPAKLGDMSELAASVYISHGCNYKLFGVVDHEGSNNSGHYTAKCKNPKTNEWNNFNDRRVCKVDGTLVSNNAYMLFYIQQSRFSF